MYFLFKFIRKKLRKNRVFLNFKPRLSIELFIFFVCFNAYNNNNNNNDNDVISFLIVSHQRYLTKLTPTPSGTKESFQNPN